MGSFYPLHGYWIWFVWAIIAVLVVIGYVRVRSRLGRLERSEDPATVDARKRHAAEKTKKKHGGVE
jgi:hypothetical protein